MRLHHSLFFLLAVAGCVFAQNLKPVADRLAAQNALSKSSTSPISATSRACYAFGDYRYNDKLADYSLDAIAQRHKTDEAFWRGWKPSPAWLLRPGPALSRPPRACPAAARRRLRSKEYEMPINQQNGIHTGLADLPLSVPLDSVKHYED